MITLVQVTHQLGQTVIFEADSAKPDKMDAQEATPYSIVTDALIRRSIFDWGGEASEDTDNQTAWMRGYSYRIGVFDKYNKYEELTE